jgi:KaiC/GvpD/RAD55 family RecA-like ATPase
MASLIKHLREMDCTTFLISEVSESDLEAGHYGVEEFVVDGVINLHNFLLRDVRQRAIEVLKMRHVEHDTFLHPFKITRSGIEVYPHERVFKE